MKRKLLLIFMIVGALTLNYCEKEPEVSPERFQVLADTISKEMDYEVWMDFAYEMAKYYPEEYMSGMALVQAAERAIMQRDEERFDKLFDVLKDYPESGALEMTDQIAIGNRFAWAMTDQSLLFEKAPSVMKFTIEKFKEQEQGLQWKDEIGGMIYDTQAGILIKQGDTTKAIEAFTTSLDYFEQTETLMRRGLVYERTGNLEGALEDFIIALSQAPGQAMISNKVMTVYSMLNPDEDAQVFIQDLHESLQESRKEEVIAEAFFADAPEFQFTDLSGKVINNSSLLGKVVFVDFWATWCNPCRRELPEFQAFYELHKDNPRVAFIAASTDSEKEKVKPFVDQMGLTFPIAYADDNATKFGVEGIPSLFIIGPSGKIRYKIVGYDPDKEFVIEMNWRLASLLDG